MSYEIHLNIPEDSQRGHLIASLAAEQHLTPSQAVESIIDLVAQKQIPTARKEGKSRIPGLPSEPMSVEDAAVVDEAKAIVMAARRQRSADRRARREALAETRPETPDALIGFLADAPEIAENIRQLAHERRRHAFGF